MSNPYRNEQNVRMYKSLFYETALGEKRYAIYTLKEEDYLGYPSIYRLYLECNDPTEFTIATTYFDSVDHWERLCQAEWFKPHLDKMRRALELKLKSEAVAALIKDAKTTSKSAASSQKFLLEKFSLISPDKRAPGRPSKAEISAEAQRIASVADEINDDYRRLLKHEVN